MSRPFFFGNNPATSAPQSQYLIQFKAGKLVKNGNLVSPVKEKKGLLYLYQAPEDQLMHFCWKDRTSGNVEDDLIIFPDEAEFLKVPQCTTGRVFVLKFKTSPRRLFFWSQEGKDDKDDEYVTKFNEYINNPPPARSSGGSGAGAGGGGGLSGSDLSMMNTEDDLRNLFSNSDMNAQQLMSMLGSVRGLSGTSGLASLLDSAVRVSGGANAGSGSSNRNSANANANASSNVSTPVATLTPASTPAQVVSSTGTSEPTSGGNNSPAGLRMADLQTIISGLSTQGRKAEDNDVSVDLSSSINHEALRPLLNNESFMQRIKETLPASAAAADSASANQTVAQQFTSTVQSPQFQQALSSFSMALQSGQLGPLIQQFGLPEDCVSAANSANLEAFVKALQKQPGAAAAAADSSKSTAGGSSTPAPKPPTPGKKDDKSDDEGMSLD